MIERGEAERTARLVSDAWAIAFRRATGSLEEARALLGWLDSFQLDEDSPRYRVLRLAAENGERPAAVSTCDELAAMRWYVRPGFVFGYDTRYRVFAIPEAALAMPPLVTAEARPAGD
jgi:hypothetical protein